MYELISAEQQQAVSKVMMSTQPTCFQDQLIEAQQQGPSTPSRVGGSKSTVTSESVGHGIRLFGDLTHCNIGNLTINIKISTLQC